MKITEMYVFPEYAVNLDDMTLEQALRAVREQAKEINGYRSTLSEIADLVKSFVEYE